MMQSFSGMDQRCELFIIKSYQGSHVLLFSSLRLCGHDGGYRLRRAGWGPTTGRTEGAQETPDHPDSRPAETVQGLLRHQSQALQEGEGGAGQGHGAVGASRPGLVPEPAGQDEENAAEEQAGQGREANREGQQEKSKTVHWE